MNFSLCSNLAMAQEEGYALKLGWEELSESLLYETIQKLVNQQRCLAMP